MTEPPRREPFAMTTQKLLLFFAVLCFVLAAAGVAAPYVSLLALGLLFFAGSFLAV